MKNYTTQKLVAWLALISGLSISAVAVYYSVVGLTAIFAAAVVPIVVMGATLEISKLIATVWLKQNWDIAPKSIKLYLLTAIGVLMLITSMGIFGFLSKAHLDQNVPTGEISAKVAIIDEKIKTERDNIDTAKKALQQMDAQVDQMLGRTTDDRGANRAVQIRKQQAKERKSLQADIANSQKIIAKLNEERAPIASELRKVEAEVGPIKYIAAFFYESTDPTILEKAVTWVIITLIVVFDPLAVILLLASQISFQYLRDQTEEEEAKEFFEHGKEIARHLDLEEKLNKEVELLKADREKWKQIASELENQPKEPVDPLALWNQMLEAAEGKSIKEPVTLPPKPHVWETTVYPAVDPYSIDDEEDSGMNEEIDRSVSETELLPVNEDSPVKTVDWTSIPESQSHIYINGTNMKVEDAKKIYPQTPGLDLPAGYVQNEEQLESSRWRDLSKASQISEEEYRLKAAENTIEDFVKKVRRGELSISKVPYEIQETVKEKLKYEK